MPDNKTVTFDAQDVEKLRKFLDIAAGEGYVLSGIDAGDLYCSLFDENGAPLVPTPAAQSAGQEAIYQARIYGGWDDVSRSEFEQIEANERPKRIVYAAPVNGGERELGQVIDARDQYHDAAEKLADAIAKHFGVEIGEHSNLNCPWQNALDHIAQATKRAADAQQVACSSFEFNHIGHEYTVYGDAAAIKALLQYRKHLEDVTANALKRAALTSPAKVGRDEREADIDAHVIDRFATILAEISLTIKGAEEPMHRHSYHDLPKLVAELKLEVDLHRSNEEARAAVHRDGGDEREAFDTLVGKKIAEADVRGIARMSWLSALEYARAALSADTPYRDAVDAALVVDHLGVASGDAKADLNRLLAYEQELALDPRVSSEARALIEKGKALALSADGGEDKRDAERYRWLVANASTGSIGFGDWWINADEPTSEWNAAIDAAIAANQAGKGGE